MVNSLFCTRQKSSIIWSLLLPQGEHLRDRVLQQWRDRNNNANKIYSF